MSMNKTSESPLINCPLCQIQRCRHSNTLSSDAEYLNYLDEFHTNPGLWRKLWYLHYHPSESANLGLDITKYKDKLDTCQRISDKRKQIQDEMESNTLRIFREAGYSGPDFSELVDGIVDIEEVNKECLTMFLEETDAWKSREKVNVEDSDIISHQ